MVADRVEAPLAKINTSSISSIGTENKSNQSLDIRIPEIKKLICVKLTRILLNISCVQSQQYLLKEQQIELN